MHVIWETLYCLYIVNMHGTQNIKVFAVVLSFVWLLRLHIISFAIKFKAFVCVLDDISFEVETELSIE